VIVQTESRYQNELERLREVDRMKDDLIALVSHELRTPLTSIVGYLELITGPESEPLTEDQSRYLKIIRRNSERLLALVSDLLVVAQAESGNLKLTKDEVDLAAVARESAAALEPAAVSRRVELRLECDDPLRVVADRKRIAQVIDNLLSNAVKFTPEGGSITLRVHNGGDAAEIEVEDTGIGIPPQEQEQLFTRFFRSHAAVKSAVQGTGLGLSIVKAIVEAHSGTVSVSSRVSEGSTFRVRLPLGGDEC
jgi:signal transduction histidine kinase